MQRKNSKKSSFLRNSYFRLPKGFTLIEILVAMTIFSLIVGIASGLFLSALKVQRKSLASQEILDQTSYLMEYISRALRMAKKDLAGVCIEKGSNYENPGHNISKIRFLSYQDYCQEFSLIDGQLGKRESPNEKETDLGEFLPLTSNNLQVESAKFQLAGQEQGDDLQPRVTIFLDIKSKEESEIKIQTTISQRNLDVRY